MSWRDQYDEVQDAEIWYRDFDVLSHLHGPVEQLYRNDFPQPDLSLLKIRKDDGWGIADADGRVILSPEWDSVGPLPQSGGAILFWRWNEDAYATLAGLADATGRILLEPCCYMVLRVEAERALVMRQIVLENNYSWEAVWLNWDGAVVDRPAWAFALTWSSPFSSGITRITMDGKVNYIDLTGSILYETWWDDMGEFGGTNRFHSDEFVSPLTWARQGDRFGFVSRTGEVVIPLQFTSAGSFYDGVALVRRGEERIAIDTQGGTLYTCTWEKASGQFSRGFIWVMQDGRYGLMNTAGELVVPCEWDQPVAIFLHGDMTHLERDGQLGFVNRQGELVTGRLWDKETVSWQIQDEYLFLLEDGVLSIWNADGTRLY